MPFIIKKFYLSFNQPTIWCGSCWKILTWFLLPMLCTVFCIHVLRENASYHIFAKDKLLLPSNLEYVVSLQDCKSKTWKDEKYHHCYTIFSLLIVSPFFPSLWDFLHYTFAKGPNQNATLWPEPIKKKGNMYSPCWII